MIVWYTGVYTSNGPVQNLQRRTRFHQMLNELFLPRVHCQSWEHNHRRRRCNSVFCRHLLQRMKRHWSHWEATSSPLSFTSILPPFPPFTPPVAPLPPPPELPSLPLRSPTPLPPPEPVGQRVVIFVPWFSALGRLLARASGPYL